jgi:hypothetical protein
MQKSRPMPFSDLLPPLSTEEFKALESSIKTSGVRDPVLVDEQGNALNAPTFQPEPNWPLREAFSYLRLLSNWARQFGNSSDCAFAARRELEDKMRLGYLRVWGHDNNFTYASLEEIDSSFWTGTVLDAYSLWTTMTYGSAMSKRAPYKGVGNWQFRDLQVDRRQVKEIWSLAPIFVRYFLRRRMLNREVDQVAKERWERELARRKRWRRYRRIIFVMRRKWTRNIFSWIRSAR